MTKKDEDRKGKRKKKSKRRVESKRIEWAFKPTLGQKIEPELTKEEFEEFLTRLSVPTQEKNGQEKIKTSA